MREIVAAIIVLSLTALLMSASAETPTTISNERQAQILAKLTPTGKQWLSTEITKARSTSGFTGQQVRGDAQRAIQNGSIPADVDIEAIAVIVLMEASKKQEDLKEVMDGVKLINKQKDGLRKIQDTVNKLSAGVASDVGAATGPCTVGAATKPCAAAPKVITPGLLEGGQGPAQQGPSSVGTPTTATGTAGGAILG
ncbi:MAG: hypothetical protein ACXWKC_09780 [Xanthobacteraceae bacterium]